MLVDKRGRTRKLNLSKRQGLLAVIEAITNSVHAIDDLQIDDGKIQVIIEREKSQEGLFTGNDSAQNSAQNSLIENFIIKDNGIGFTKENFISFNRSDSTYKADRGGKGVGRFLWLKAFDRVEVESIYENEGQKFKREFAFSFDDEPEKTEEETLVDNETKLETTVKLLGYKSEYAENTVSQLETIAKRVVEQCLMFFVKDIMPKLSMHDKVTGETLTANKLYKDSLKEKSETSLSIAHSSFDLSHVMFEATGNIQHKIYYFGNNRVVDDKNLRSEDINGLSGKLQHKDSNVVYLACVSGEYLDENISDDRTSFNFPKQDELELGLSFGKIQESVLGASKDFLSPYTAPVLDEHRKRIRKIIEEEMPQYRVLAANYSERFDTIPSNTSGTKLDLALYSIDKELGLELKQKTEEIISSTDLNVYDDYSFCEEFSEYGKAKLAEYIAHRHSVLRLLKHSLSLNEDGTYAPEKAIHNLIFPMGKTSDEVNYEDHNLWIIDEKLAYHYYLASDKKLKSIAATESNALGEPDLIVFNRPFAIVNEDDPPYQSIVIFEFKRPMRNDYKDGTFEDYKDNPVSQVNRYVIDILKGTTDRKGRPLKAKAGTPFYCYIVASITPKMEEIMLDRSFTATPDGLGSYFYNRELNSYIEVISYDKLLKDAKNRNKILFDKLKLPHI